MREKIHFTYSAQLDTNLCTLYIHLHVVSLLINSTNGADASVLIANPDETDNMHALLQISNICRHHMHVLVGRFTSVAPLVFKIN